MANENIASNVFENLPEELQGVDCSPDKLAPMKNDFDTIQDRIIITYKKEQMKELADFLGLPLLDKKAKVVYTFEEVMANKKFGLF